MSSPKKYNRSYHLPFSLGRGSDDKVLDTCDHFLGKEIVITAKLDGSNCMLSRDHIFARSHNGPPTHPSFDLAKSIHSETKYSIPTNLAIYGEYCYALHSISYTALPHYINIFNILDTDRNVWLSWDSVEEHSKTLKLPTVPLLYRGVVERERDLEAICAKLMKEKEFGVDEREGVVVRLAAEFRDEDFGVSLGKAVRKDHVNSDDHWAHKEIIRNGLRR